MSLPPALFNDENAVPTKDKCLLGDVPSVPSDLPVSAPDAIIPDVSLRTALSAVDVRAAELAANLLPCAVTGGRGGGMLTKFMKGDIHPSEVEMQRNTGREHFGSGGRCAIDEGTAAASSHNVSPTNEEVERLDYFRCRINEARGSLSSHLLRVARPVSSVEYRSADPLDDDGSTGESLGEEMEVMSLGTSMSSSSESEAENEISEEDLLDSDIYQRARALREDVRRASAIVRDVRDAQMGKAVDLARREVEAMSRSYPKGDTSESRDGERGIHGDIEFSKSVLNTNCDGRDGGLSEEECARIKAMQDKIAAVLCSLHEIDVDLPGKIEPLRRTISTIEMALFKSRGLEETRDGDRREDKDQHTPMISQIERSIVSKEVANEIEEAQIAMKECYQAEKDRANSLPPDKRFTLYMSQA